MAHWSVEHAIKTLIGALVLAALSGIAYVALIALKVPDIELQLKKHDEKLTTISVSLLTLMQKTGNPPEEKELKNLVSSVLKLGEAKAELIVSAQLEQGSGMITPANWVPEGLQPMLSMKMSAGVSVMDKEKVAKLIAASVVSGEAVTWTVSGSNLKMQYGDEGRFVLVPAKGISTAELDTWAASLNTLGTEVSKVVMKETHVQRRE